MFKRSYTSEMSSAALTVQRVVFQHTSYETVDTFDSSMPTMLVFIDDTTVGGVTIKAGTTFTMCTEAYSDEAYRFTGVVHSRTEDAWYAFEASLRTDNTWEVTYKVL